MRTLTPLAMTMLGAAALQAQPTLTQATNSFAIGQDIILNYSPYSAAGPAGSDQAWDFSMLMVDSTTFVQWVDPATTTYGALFPQATIAELWEVVSFTEQSAGGIFVLGTDEQGTVVPLSDARRTMAWPLGYGDSWSDPYAGGYSVQGYDVTRTGTYGGQADAYGTLQLPWGTVADVLRIHVTAQQSDVSPLFGTIDQDIDSYQWFVPGSPWPLLEVVTNTVTTSWGPTTISYALWAAEAPTGVAERHVATTALWGWPAPGGSAIMLNRSVSGVLIDAAGRTAATVNRQAQISTAGLAPGVYTLRVDDGATMRFVRE